MDRLTFEARNINYQFIMLIRQAYNECPEATDKLFGIDQETAARISALPPSKIEAMTKNPVTYFQLRFSKHLLADLVRAVENTDQREIDCNLQQIAAVAV